MKVPNAEIVFLFAGSCIAIVQNLTDSTVLLTSPLTCCCSAGCSATRPAPSTAGATPSWSRGQWQQQQQQQRYQQQHYHCCQVRVSAVGRGHGVRGPRRRGHAAGRGLLPAGPVSRA